ncbi:MAG: response regulator transcription factor [Clostridia bacterium]|nr:response regulator transcription factor [Clostridia bacterium]
MLNILVCDDEKDIVAALEIYLTAEGYRVLPAFNGREAVELAKANEVHLAILDVMMPALDGIAATARLRETANFPIILLTAKSEDSDKVLGLTVGADDYVTKPFNPVELLARVKSQLRRYTQLGGMPPRESALSVCGVTLDDEKKTVTRDGEPVGLTPTEYGILRLLMRNPNKVFSSRQIYESVWRDTALGAENTVAVHIRHLREKLEINPEAPRFLKVVWGLGYKIETERES